VRHERLFIVQDWADPGRFQVACSCGWYAHRPSIRKAKAEFHHHVIFSQRSAA